MPPSHPRARHEDTEPTSVTFLTADIRPLIHAASPAELRGAHDAVAGHLRHYLTSDPGTDGQELACLQPAIRLCRKADKAAAAILLLAISTTNQTSGPAAAASPEQLRVTLLGLADAIDTVHRDAEAAATAINDAGHDLTSGLHASGMAVIAAARLHRLAVRAQVIHLLYHLWSHLDPGTSTIPDFPDTLPMGPPPGDVIALN